MKRLMMILAASLLLAPAFAQQGAPTQEPVQLRALRSTAIDGPSAPSENHVNQRDTGPLPRDFVQQPPLIPHTIRGYAINKNFNKCLDCHAWNRTRFSGATKISVTHFKSYSGTELSNISPRRYFCTQCHVPQTDAQPLVNNTFQPAPGMR